MKWIYFSKLRGIWIVLRKQIEVYVRKLFFIEYVNSMSPELNRVTSNYNEARRGLSPINYSSGTYTNTLTIIV